MGKVMYCDKCGNIYRVLFSKKCKYCKTKMKPLSKEMQQKYNIFNDNWCALFSEMCKLNTAEKDSKIIEEMIFRKNEFVMNEITRNPSFSMHEYERQMQNERKRLHELAEFYNKRDRERFAKSLAKMQRDRESAAHMPRCPICGSSDIHKIAIGTRAVKTAAFGIAGAVDDAGKTYKCSNCGSKF